QAKDGIRDRNVTGVQTCALPILKTAANLKPSSLPSKIRQSKKRLSLPPRVVRNWHLKRLSSDTSQGFSRSRCATHASRRTQKTLSSKLSKKPSSTCTNSKGNLPSPPG